MAYKPNKAVHPGYQVARALEREGMTQKNLCDRTGLSEKHLSQIVNGEASITIETALSLENALGGTAAFWINLDKNYQETKARIERLSILSGEVDLLIKYPYAELARRGRGYVQATLKSGEKVESLCKFFGVNSLNFIPTVQPVAYRKRAVNEGKDGAIATWLRCGEIDARENKVAPFSETTLKNTLPQLRALSLKAPKDFSIEAQTILAKSGVSLVYVEHFKGTGVSGAVRWVGDNPLIQLSLLGTYADRFWFNLFHEIGHLIYHGKKGQFIEFKNPQSGEKELEANSFAADVLIPKENYVEFVQKGDFSKQSVLEFAQQLSIHPGIVEGRLKHEKKLNWRQSLGLQDQLAFKKDETA